MKFLSLLKYNFRRFVLLNIILVSLSFGATKIYANDFEIWTFVGAETAWKRVEFSLENANFFMSGDGWFLNYTQASFDFNTKQQIYFGVAYKQEYVKVEPFRRVEYRPMLHLYYSKIWGDFEFRDRNRLEFRFFETGMIKRYRNQLKVKYNKSEKIIPYASTEFFFYFDNLRYVRQRSALGLNIPIKSVNVNVFGAHQVDKILPKYWYKKFMLGTSLNYNF